MLTQHFFIEGEFLGQCERDFLYTQLSQLPYEPFSLAYFCPRCGEIWARFPIAGGSKEALRFKVLDQNCRKHLADQNFMSVYDIPGSVLHHAHKEELNSILPYEVLQWEFHRHADWWEFNQQRGFTND